MKSREDGPILRRKKFCFIKKMNAPCHKSIKNIVKLDELGYKLLSHPPYSLALAPSDFFFADLKRMLAGKKFSSNEEVIAYY
jgi:hypothetical protein